MHPKGVITVAGASMNDIKARMKSVRSTMQITKAMELVASSKLRRAKLKVEASRPFHEILKEAIDEIRSLPEAKRSAWSKPVSEDKTLLIVIAGDRGLAGGYNSAVFKLADSLANPEHTTVLPIGKKACEYYRYRGRTLFTESVEYVQDMSVGNSLAYADAICESYRRGEFGRVILVYTRFVSMLTQTPVYDTLLPLSEDKSEKAGSKNTYGSDPIYGGEPEEILDKIIPSYIGGLINTAVNEAGAAESAARRTAMNAANKNASEMIDTLMLKFNRARQAIITQEIAEIVSGAGD